MTDKLKVERDIIPAGEKDGPRLGVRMGERRMEPAEALELGLDLIFAAYNVGARISRKEGLPKSRTIELEKIRETAQAFLDKANEESSDGPVQFIAVQVLGLVEEIERLQWAYVPQDVSAECHLMLMRAGFGTFGQTNTLWGMTQAITEAYKRLDAYARSQGFNATGRMTYEDTLAAVDELPGVEPHIKAEMKKRLGKHKADEEKLLRDEQEVAMTCLRGENERLREENAKLVQLARDAEKILKFPKTATALSLVTADAIRTFLDRMPKR